ncbi:MAG TPA: biliverdin-producing heme oxygenase, partial [Chthoniobacterales bacterium]
ELPLLADNLDLFTYRSVLECFFGLYAPLEEGLGKLRPCLAELTDLEQRWKTPLLAHDLSALGVRLPDVPLSPYGNLPLESRAQALGVMYVLEGATLGGQIMARHVRERLHLDEANGASFLQGYGRLTGPRWQAFLTVARRLIGDHAEASEAVASAGRTFEAFLSWSRRCGLAHLPPSGTKPGANLPGP